MTKNATIPDQEKISYWQDLAQYDLVTAEAMLSTGRLLYVGFMCHQVIEKTLKALYVKIKNDVPPYTHNLALISQDCGLLNILTETQKNFLSVLQPLNIESRYPFLQRQAISDAHTSAM